MQIENLPRPTKFVFWCTAPFFIATIVLMPFLANPPQASGRIVLWGAEVFLTLALFGLYDPERFSWCWRSVGALAFVFSSVCLVSAITAGKWADDGSPMPDTVGTAIKGFLAFGLPGLVYAVFGRFTWNPPPKAVNVKP